MSTMVLYEEQGCIELELTVSDAWMTGGISH